MAIKATPVAPRSPYSICMPLATPYAGVGLLRDIHIESGECSQSSWPLRPLRLLRARRIQSARRSLRPMQGWGLLRDMHIESGECSQSSWPLRPLRLLRARRIQSACRSLRPMPLWTKNLCASGAFALAYFGRTLASGLYSGLFVSAANALANFTYCSTVICSGRSVGSSPSASSVASVTVPFRLLRKVLRR